jgi:hypothetical protein
MVGVSPKCLTSEFLRLWIKSNQPDRLLVLICPPRYFFEGLKVWSTRQRQCVNGKLPLGDGVYRQLPDARVDEVSVAVLHETIMDEQQCGASPLAP